MMYANLSAQNVYNTYQDFTGQPYNIESSPISSYSGEFQWVMFDDHHWFDPTYPLSYKFEVVSFPFLTDKTKTDADPDDLRFFKMPTSYDALNKTWSHNNGFNAMTISQTDKGTFLREAFSVLLGLEHEYTLESFSFRVNSAGFGTTYPYEIILPHSVIKFTLYSYCDDDDRPDDSLTTIIDATRGSLRYYPYYNSNYLGGMGSTSAHDLVVYIWTLDAPIDASSNALNTIANFDYDDVEHMECFEQYTNPGTPPNPLATEADYMHPSPYSLLAFDIRSAKHMDPAGYENDPLELASGIQHQYVIDQNIDLTIINPTENIIYNPSKVTITATDLIFPSGYTFKTTRGIYPTASESMFSVDVHCDVAVVPDMSDVTVLTDLDPSIYYLKRGSKLTIEPCVRIFDAEFVVETGAELVYHPSDTWGNFTITNAGGTVTSISSTETCNDCECMQEYDLINPEITSNTTWTTNKSILGKLKIKSGATLTIKSGAIITFTDSKRTDHSGYTFCGIEVEKNARLNVIENATLDVVECDAMWDGIIVYGDGTKEQPNLIPGTNADFGIVNLNNCNINNARIGVYSGSTALLVPFPIHYPMGFKKGGGIVQGFKAKFNNNAISLFYGPYKFDHKFKMNECTFTNSRFLRDQETYYQQSLVAHVVAYECRNLQFPGCKFYNTSPIVNSDYFLNETTLSNYNRGTGIIGKNSEIFVEPKPGVTVKLPYFEGMHTGIESECWTGFPDGLRVKQGQFTNVPQGITVLGSDFDEIVGCNFNVPDNTLNVIDGSSSIYYGTDSWAIYHSGGHDPLIYQNTINGESVAVPLYDTDGEYAISYGVVISSSHGAGMVYKNTFADVNTGTQTEYANDYLTITCDDYTNHNSAWNIGEPIDFIEELFETPTLGNQGTSCDDELTTVINYFHSNTEDIYSNVAFDYFAFGTEGTETGPESFGIENITYCGYESDPSVFCPDLEALLMDLPIKPKAEIAYDIESLSDLRTQQLLLHQYIRLYENHPDSIIDLLVLLDDSYNDPILFNSYLCKNDSTACIQLYSQLANTTMPEKSYRKFAKILSDKMNSDRTIVELSTNEISKLQQLISVENWVTARSMAMLNATNFQIANPHVLFSDSVILRQGVNLSPKLLSLECYPNPSTDIFEIKLITDNNESLEEIRVYDQFGRLVNLQDLINNYGNIIELNFNNQPSGLYVIYAFISGQVYPLTTKLIKL